MRLAIFSVALAFNAAMTGPAAGQTHALSDNLIRLLDTGDIKAVAGALQEHGYKAEIKKNDKGESYILSGANGSTFQIIFYGCKGDTGCQSYDFYSWYNKDSLYTPELANEWNATKRFLTINVGRDGTLEEYVYVSAVGETTYANFFDSVDWFASMDGELATFLKEKRDKAVGAVGKK